MLAIYILFFLQNLWYVAPLCFLDSILNFICTVIGLFSSRPANHLVRVQNHQILTQTLLEMSWLPVNNWPDKQPNMSHSLVKIALICCHKKQKNVLEVDLEISGGVTLTNVETQSVTLG